MLFLSNTKRNCWKIVSKVSSRNLMLDHVNLLKSARSLFSLFPSSLLILKLQTLCLEISRLEIVFGEQIMAHKWWSFFSQT